MDVKEIKDKVAEEAKRIEGQTGIPYKFVMIVAALVAAYVLFGGQ
jgi:hypothetical protein